MSDTSPLLDLPFVMPAQAQKHVPVNDALMRLDALVHLSVLSMDFTDPPADPAPGDRYIPPASAGGGWTGLSGQVVAWDGVAWRAHVPAEGWRVWVADQGQMRVYSGGNWAVLAAGSGPGDLQNLPGIGIGTTSDANNPLAVAGPATLLSHAGAGHQLKVNKAAPSDTASLLFQSGWSGRAEMGLAGNDDFSLKTSPDGSSFTEALVVQASDGITRALGLYSVEITVAVDAAASVIPPRAHGLMAVSSDQGVGHAGLISFDTATPALAALASGADLALLPNGAPTGQTGTAGNTGLAADTNMLWIENRSSASATYRLTFLS